MKKYIIISFAVATTFTCEAQTKMTNEQLDSLCREMTDKYRATFLDRKALENRLFYISNSDKTMRHWFPVYLSKVYDTVNAPGIHISEKRLENSKLLRIAEGRFRIETREGYLKREAYRIPAEMSETEYFFLNGGLVKISITKGATDYNALPENYWFQINQLDLMYEKNKVVKKAAYFYFDQWDLSTKVSDEWTALFTKHHDIDEEALIERAYIVYHKFSKINSQ